MLTILYYMHIYTLQSNSYVRDIITILRYGVYECPFIYYSLSRY